MSDTKIEHGQPTDSVVQDLVGDMYARKLMPYTELFSSLSQTFEVAGEIPPVVSNEVRNAITHIARVYAAPDVRKREYEVQNARWHLMIAITYILFRSTKIVMEGLDNIYDFMEAAHASNAGLADLEVRIETLRRTYQEITRDIQGFGLRAAADIVRHAELIERQERLLIDYLRLYRVMEQIRRGGEG